MNLPHVLVVGPYPGRDLAALDADYTVHRLWEASDQPAFLAAAAPLVRAIATRGDLGAKADLIAALPHVEVIVCYGVGVDGIDLAAARARNIPVTNTPDVLTDDTADMALALMLAVSRQIPQGNAYVRSGDWASKGDLGLARKLSRKRLGIVGMGRIGAAVARRAAGFDMAIAYHNRTPRTDVPYDYVGSIAELAARSDMLVATVSGGAATTNLIGAAELAALGPDGIFINVARGTVVDEEALLAALENRTIAAAGLDVYRNEPKINPRFFALDNAVLQPHMGSATVETRAAMGDLMRANLAAHFAGQPLLTPVSQ
jgi:lactate dehydrogenase-like 2-hydroxyacid dehydrogenase